MRYSYIIILACCMAFTEGCYQNDEHHLYNELNAYHGVWRDTLNNNGIKYIEDLFLSDNTFEHTLTDMSTRIVCDKESGFLIIGNENKMRWVGISPITNTYRQSVWDVLCLSPYQMRLFSNYMGMRNYRKVYCTSFEEYSVQDTLAEMLQYKDHLPLSINALKSKFGEYNSQTGIDGITYFLNHPLFDKISFKEQFENDTIFSYTLSVSSNYWNTCRQIITSQYYEKRSIGGNIEFYDAEELEDANLIITLDSRSHQVTLSSIKGYDYWPNISRFLNMNLQDVKAELGMKYVYTYHEFLESGLREYLFQTSKDSTCSSIGIMIDTMGTVRSCSVSLLTQYMRTKKAEAVKEEDRMALFLKKKYLFSKEETDENSNKVYYYHSFNASSGAMLEIKLRLKYYQNGISNLYCVTIDYRKL